MGILLALGMALFVPVLLIMPPIMCLLAAPITVPTCVIAIIANILNFLYRTVIAPLIQGFFSIPVIQDIITAPARYLYNSNVLGRGWKNFLEQPQTWMGSLCHNFILCFLLALPEYYWLSHLAMPTFSPMDWCLHILLVDSAIGVAMQFSPTLRFQERLGRNEDHAVIMGAINGVLCGVTQGLLGYGLFSTALGLGPTGIMTGCVTNMVCAKVIQTILEFCCSHSIWRNDAAYQAAP